MKKNLILRLLPVMGLCFLGTCPLFASDNSSDEELTGRNHLPLVGKYMTQYLREISQEIEEPVTLKVTLSPFLGGNSIEIPLIFQSVEIPEEITKEFLLQKIAKMKLFNSYITQMKEAQESEINMKVTLFFEGNAQYKEKINASDVINVN